MKRDFASDNSSGVHPKILEAITKANVGNQLGYGNDDYTLKAIEKFKEIFSPDIDVYFVYNGTGANVTALKTVTNSYHSILCTNVSHINVDECGAPEKYTGCKVIAIEENEGKLTCEKIKDYLHGFGVEHHSQPKIISITQSTEYGTVYSPEEIKNLANLAHQNNMLLHIDGARISNACASLNLSLKELTMDCGADILSFGGTKNGMMFGEAVIFFDKKLSADFKYARKQGMQLASKMRFISAQFLALLENELWRENATHANKMALLLADKIKNLPNIKITQKVQANSIFAIIPKEITASLQEKFPFYVWTEKTNEVRWMCSFDTTEKEIFEFFDEIEKLCKLL